MYVDSKLDYYQYPVKFACLLDENDNFVAAASSSKVNIEKSCSGRSIMEQELRFGLDLGRMTNLPGFIVSKSSDL